MRRPKLSRLAARLKYALAKNPAFTELPRCTRCGLLTKLADWSKRENCCVGCEMDADPMNWHDDENDRPFLPEEEDQ